MKLNLLSKSVALAAYTLVFQYFGHEQSLDYLIVLAVVPHFVLFSQAKSFKEICVLSSLSFFAASGYIQFAAITAAINLYKAPIVIAVACFLALTILTQIVPILLLSFTHVFCLRLKYPRELMLLTYPLVLFISDLINPGLFPVGLNLTIGFLAGKWSQLFSLIGIEGVVGFLYLFSALIALALVTRHRLIGSGLSFFTLFSLLVLGSWQARVEKKVWSTYDSKLTIAAFQSNNTYDFSLPPANYEKRARQTLNRFEDFFFKSLKKGGGKVDFFLFSETEYTFYNSDENGQVEDQLLDMAAQNSKVIIGGAEIEYDDESRTNSLFVIDAEGELVHSYDKIHLIPFGEFRPFSQTLPELSKWLPGQDFFRFGDSFENAIYNYDGTNLGFSICYEALFRSIFLNLTNFDAEVFVVISNDALFGDSALMDGHSAFVHARALEARRPIIRVVRTGKSSAMLASGKVIFMSQPDRAFERLIEISYKSKPEKTLVMAHPNWANFIFVFVALIVKSCFALLFVVKHHKSQE